RGYAYFYSSLYVLRKLLTGSSPEGNREASLPI
ncbi:hypothetical protein CEXT_301221, partial [Caerostris extrusa]